MARLSLHIPDTLHERLNRQARQEGVSLHQFLLFLLAERSRPAYEIGPADKTVEEQRAAFARLREKLGSAPDEEVWKILDERGPAPPEADERWTPELRQALEDRIEAARKLVPGL